MNKGRTAESLAEDVRLYITSLPTVQAKPKYLLDYIGTKCKEFALANFSMHEHSSIVAIGNSALKSIDWTEYNSIKEPIADVIDL
jgi:hypothetical protein